MFSRGRIVAMVDYGRVGALARHTFGGGVCRAADPLPVADTITARREQRRGASIPRLFHEGGRSNQL